MTDEELNRKIDELNKALQDDIDRHYYPNSGKKPLSEKEHFELWDEMFRLSCERRAKKGGPMRAAKT